jgi:hypothetical protein
VSLIAAIFILASNQKLSKRARQVSIVVPQDSTVMKDETNKSDPCSIIFDYCLNASTHGLLGIARSASLHNRVFWSISVLGFTGLMIYFVVNAIIDYFGYPTNMNINVVNEYPQYFPAFSLCNAGPLRMDQFIGPFLNYTNALNLTDTNDTTTLSEVQSGYIWPFISERLNSNQPFESFFYSLPSMLYSCKYNSLPCSAADFIPFTSSSYGQCYTFNAKLKNSNSSVRYGNENGGNGELDLSLYVQSHQYVPYTAHGKQNLFSSSSMLTLTFMKVLVWWLSSMTTQNYQRLRRLVSPWHLDETINWATARRQPSFYLHRIQHVQTKFLFRWKRCSTIIMALTMAMMKRFVMNCANKSMRECLQE